MEDCTMHRTAIVAFLDEFKKGDNKWGYAVASSPSCIRAALWIAPDRVDGRLSATHFIPFVGSEIGPTIHIDTLLPEEIEAANEAVEKAAAAIGLKWQCAPMWIDRGVFLVEFREGGN